MCSWGSSSFFLLFSCVVGSIKGGSKAEMLNRCSLTCLYRGLGGLLLLFRKEINKSWDFFFCPCFAGLQEVFCSPEDI